ncbi:MAG: T9SS type A sorting domain-containing protein [Taibaiella sp.]|nr:T9SS type A sorting domain-containing protein [Taibaiella sp.]
MRFWMSLIIVFYTTCAWGGKLLIPMDAAQTNHLKAYGIVYAAIANGGTVEWLLNYRGGSFVLDNSTTVLSMCRQRGVVSKAMSASEYATIIKKVKAPAYNGDVVSLTTVPRIAVYTPSNKKPWDDAVTLALTYAGIPFDKIYVTEVLDGALSKYDWLHLHHEDFTGQFGKFWIQYKDVPWYRADVRAAEALANREGYTKVWQMQHAVVHRIRDFVGAGGNLFAMCSATDTYDIALAADGIDICDVPYDGDGLTTNAQQKLNFDNCFAFTGFTLTTNLQEYEHATIDNTAFHLVPESTDYFMLKPFPAKFDPVPAMLCQNHTRKVKGFMGQTTAFRKEVLKPDVVVLADKKDLHEARYIHGKYKQGTWTFYGGHDPEDYEHKVGEAPTDLDKHPQSPGYRLILNNVLCLASGRKDVPAVEFGKKHSTDAAPITNKMVNIAAGNTSNSLVISLAGSVATKQIELVELLNAEGKTVFSKTFQTTSASVDMDNLPAGLYTIRVNGQYAGKVVKN